MSETTMKLPSEYTFSVSPVRNADGRLVDPSYVKFAEFKCTKCGHVQAPAHGLDKGTLDQYAEAWNQTAACPECGAENAWGWEQIEKLSETPTVIDPIGATDKASAAGSGAKAGGADLTKA